MCMRAPFEFLNQWTDISGTCMNVLILPNGPLCGHEVVLRPPMPLFILPTVPHSLIIRR
jgi:hypothetical protein